MKIQNNKIWIFALLLLIVVLSGCKKAGDAVDRAKDEVSQLAEQATQASPIIITGEGNNTQIVIPAAQQPQQNFQTADVLSPNYRAPCILQKFAVLNLYCKGKTLFVQQSETLSWHVPYGFILFVLVVFLVWFIIHLWRKQQ